MSLNISKGKAYKRWVEDLKNRIQASQIKAAIKVNSALVDLYWQLGQEIILKQKEGNWGDAIIDQLSKDFNANKKYIGDSTYQVTMGLDEIPIFVKKYYFAIGQTIALHICYLGF